MNQNRYCVIMAGGVGSRFWPISRRSKPKQFLDILGTGKSFLRLTYERFAKMIPAENFLISTNKAYKDLVLEHIPEIAEHQVLCEPIGRNTAPCIAYAAWRLKAVNPDATMIVTPSDHLILHEDEFRTAIMESMEFAETHDALMTIGIQPNRPATGYGYIQEDTDAPTGNPHITQVKAFTEKPKLEMAKVFVESGEFLWNAGIFVWKLDTIMESLSEYLPETQSLFASIESHYNKPEENEEVAKIYGSCRNISIDYGIMEKAGNVYVRRGNLGWSDIGTWGSLYEHAPKDEDQNATLGNTTTYNTEGSILINTNPKKMMVIDGLKDYIVVDTDEVLMITPKDNEQHIKVFVDDIKYKLGDDYM